MDCPVCGQVGLPNYITDKVTCSQCNSDLSPFLLLEGLKRRHNNRPAYFLLISISLIAMVASVLFVSGKIILRGKNKQISSYKLQVSRLKDSVNELSKGLPGTPQKEQPVTESAFRYKIKKGDCAWKIAKMFYGDGGLYKRVENENNLSSPYMLQEGQVLTIKIDN